jgi:hypothetical protein
MFDQTPENGSFEFRSGFVVNGHDRDLAVLRQPLLILGGRCHRFYHIAAQTE